MADYYLQFAAILPTLQEPEIVWLNETIAYLSDRSETEIGEEEPDYVKKFYEENEAFDFQWTLLEKEYEEKLPSMLFHADEYGVPGQVAILVQQFLKTFRPKDSWTLTWAETCSKPHAEGFSGGGVFVTSEMIHTVHATDWVYTMREEYQRKLRL